MNSIAAEINPTSENFLIQCPMCEQWIDKRDKSQFAHHVHGINELRKPIRLYTSRIIESDVLQNQGRLIFA